MPPHIVIAGGGVGALEGLLALQSLAGDRLRDQRAHGVSVTSATARSPSPSRSAASRRRATTGSASPATRGVRWIPDVVEAVRPDARELVTRDGPPIRYDALLLALGARPAPVVPGAITFAGPRDVRP